MMTSTRRQALSGLAALATALATALPCAGSAAATPTHAGIQALLQRSFAADGPGAVVLVQQGDKTLHHGAVGRASLELAQPLQPDSVLRIGSVSKQFAAVLLLRQVAQGKARLDDRLDTYVAGFPNGDRITLEQLLDHTAGTRNYTDLPGYIDGEGRLTRSTAEMVRRMTAEAPDFAPGTGWRYSNTGYVLIGAVLERLTGKPWGDQLDALFAELGMRCMDAGARRQVVPRLANGYTAGEHGQPVPPPYVDLSQAQMAGAVAGCASDLLRWSQALHQGRLLPAPLYRRMTTPTPVKQPADYGLGLALTTVQGQPAVWHGGRIPGYTALLLALPAADLHVVLMRNSDSPEPHVEPLAKRLAALALGTPYPEPLAQPAPEPPDAALAGRYRGERDGVERLLRWQEGRWTLQRPNYPVQVLQPLAGGGWQIGNTLSRLQRDGLALRHRPDGDGEDERWTRVGDLPAEAAPVELTEAQMAALVGDYAGPQLSLQVFRDAAGRLMAQAPGQPAVALQAQTPLRLAVKALGATLDFELQDGQARRLTLLQGPLRLTLQRR